MPGIDIAPAARRLIRRFPSYHLQQSNSVVFIGWYPRGMTIWPHMCGRVIQSSGPPHYATLLRRLSRICLRKAFAEKLIARPSTFGTKAATSARAWLPWKSCAKSFPSLAAHRASLSEAPSVDEVDLRASMHHFRQCLRVPVG